MGEESYAEAGYRIVAAPDLISMLRRVENGEPPALVFWEFWELAQVAEKPTSIRVLTNPGAE